MIQNATQNTKHARTPERSTRDESSSSHPDKILRFHRTERLVHWALAIPFLVCYSTALILVVHYNPSPDRPYRDVFSWIHRLSGIGLIVFPTLAIVRARGDFRIHLYNIRQAWIWAIMDLKWLALMGLAAVSRRVTLPEQGKFNAAEKLNFMVLMATYPLYILTGLLIWLTDGAFLAWVVHFSMALVATPLIGGHIFMATLNPSTRKGLQGMISGFVDRQWAKHHYRRWYREQSEGEPHTSEQGLDDRSVPDQLATILCTSCKREHGIRTWAQFIRTIFTIDRVICPHCRAEIKKVSAVVEPRVLDTVVARLHRSDPAIHAMAAGDDRPLRVQFALSSNRSVPPDDT